MNFWNFLFIEADKFSKNPKLINKIPEDTKEPPAIPLARMIFSVEELTIKKLRGFVKKPKLNLTNKNSIIVKNALI